MTQPQRVIYLPPGVTPSQPAVPTGPVPSGIPFDRLFFEQVLGPSIQAFCSQVQCTVPIVELQTVDGTTHYINGISGVADSWVALQTSNPDNNCTSQVFIPYQTIFRVEIHPEHDKRREHLGFFTPTPPATATLPVPTTKTIAAPKTAVRKAKPTA